VKATESKYIEKKGYLSRLARADELAAREAQGRLPGESASEAEWLRRMREDYRRFVPFLTRKCDIQFHGRILEIGAGACWFSAALSRLPRVVEIVATDFSPRLLKDFAPRVFELLDARADKITRTPADFHKLHFGDNRFHFVVCSAVLHHAVNMVTVLREARRVLRPGGRIIAVREPVWPRFKFRSRPRGQTGLPRTGANGRLYTLAEYEEFFAQAGFTLEARRVNLSSGLKYYFNEVVSGLTPARYALVATKRARK
jgi:SAM-dependent methyltransferase